MNHPGRYFIIWGLIILVFGALLIFIIPQSVVDKNSSVNILIYGSAVFSALFLATGILAYIFIVVDKPKVSHKPSSTPEEKKE